MAMSAKGKALLTGEQTSEWNKYRKSMQEAHNEWQIEQDRLQNAADSRSDSSKLWGTIGAITLAALFVAAAPATLGWAGITKAAAPTAFKIGTGLMAATGAGIGGYAGGATHHEFAPKADLERRKPTTDIHQSKFGIGQQAVERETLAGQYEASDSAIDTYLADFSPFARAGAGHASSYIGSSIA